MPDPCSISISLTAHRLVHANLSRIRVHPDEDEQEGKDEGDEEYIREGRVRERGASCGSSGASSRLTAAAAAGCKRQQPRRECLWRWRRRLGAGLRSVVDAEALPRAQSSDRSSRTRRARHPGCGGGRRSSSRAARAAHARSCAQTAGPRSAAARRRPRGGAQRTRGRGQTHRCSVGAMRGSGACYASAAGRVTACHEPRGRLMVGAAVHARLHSAARVPPGKFLYMYTS